MLIPANAWSLLAANTCSGGVGFGSVPAANPNFSNDGFGAIAAYFTSLAQCPFRAQAV